ncbi:MAG TPA: glycosyltransferase family 39 protein [Gammaproteobacteria bacterium]|jgi:4-amino-4-deoxy-L-arabinose transferase-like glycosyltransferase|nr:glycosyltransferase family 39 protein [Gammaproteobacteria bacterium]
MRQRLNTYIQTKHRDWITDILLLTVGFLLLYTFCLGSYPLFPRDEGRYAEIAREMLITSDYITPRINGIAFLDKPVLYYWLQALSMSLFGVNEWAVRFFPMLFGITGIFVTYLCGRLLYNRRIACLGSLFLGTAPLYFAGAHYANLDLEVAVLISSSLLCFITAMQYSPKRTSFLFAAYALSGLAFLMKGLIGIVFPCLIGGSWILLINWRLLGSIFLVRGFILIACIVLPWYVFVQQANPGFLHFFFVTQQVSRFLSTQDFNNQIMIWFYLPVIMLGLFPWSLFIPHAYVDAFQKIKEIRRTDPTRLFLLIWTIVIFAFFSIPHSKIVTYILPVFPALALLIGHFIDQRWQDSACLKRYAISYIIATPLMLCLLILAIQHQWVPIGVAFHKYLIAYAGVLSFSVLLTGFYFRQKDVGRLILLWAGANILSFLIFMTGASAWSTESAKMLSLTLNRLAKPTDTIAHYYHFFPDMLFYSQRPVAFIADWQSPTIAQHDNAIREMWYGIPFQDTADKLVNEDVFWKKWNSDQRVFVFLKENYFEQFKKHTQSYFHYGKTNDIILLSNHPNFI